MRFLRVTLVGLALVAAIVPLRVGYQPIMPVAIYALIVTSPTVTPTVVAFKFRPTVASAVGEIVIGTLTLPLTAAPFTMVYKTVDNVKCLPCGEIVVSTTTGSTAGTAHFGVLYAPNWDAPGNNAKMIRSV